MSSRDDRRRRERSWEREDREKGRDRNGGRGGGGGGGYAGRRRSRSRSPKRGDRDRERDRRDGRDYPRDRYDDRRTRDRDNGRERDRDRDRERDRDRPRDKERDRERERVTGHRDDRKEPSSLRKDDRETRVDDDPHSSRAVSSEPTREKGDAVSTTPGNREDGPSQLEDGEAMDAVNEDDAAMMAMMGFGGFDSTKGKPVVGNETGIVNIKQQRTWRQYMNRRGGFNRPLDKIK